MLDYSTRRTIDELITLQSQIYQAQAIQVQLQAAGTELVITPPQQPSVVVRRSPPTSGRRSVSFR